jgi:hypothetical protein
LGNLTPYTTVESVASNMKRDPHTHELVSLTVRLGCELKRDLRECARRLELSENDIAKHAIRAATNYIKAMDYRQGPPFKMTLDLPAEQSESASE